MKEKCTTTKVVRVDDEIEVVLSERSSIDSNLEDSSSNHEDTMYPLVIAGKHNDMFIDVRDEKDVLTFKAHNSKCSIKTDDIKPPSNPRPYIDMFDTPNCSSASSVCQPSFNFQIVKSQVKEENCTPSPKRFASNSSFERSCSDIHDKDPKPSSCPRFVSDSSVCSNREGFLWYEPGSTAKSYPTYFLENDGTVSNFFDNTDKMAHIKEETGSQNAKPILHITSSSVFKLGCQQSVSPDFSEPSKDFIIGKSDGTYKLLPTSELLLPNNANTTSSLGAGNTSVQEKELKASGITLDKGAVMQAPKRKREVDLLYDNLKEISWAQDKTFTNLLGDKEIHKRFERISNSKGVGLNSRKKHINLTIGKKIIKKVSAQQRKYTSKPKVKKVKKEVHSDSPKPIKGKLGEKQEIKWYKASTHPAKNLKNKNADVLIQGKTKLNKLKPKLPDKKLSGIKRHEVVNEHPKVPCELKVTGKQSCSSSNPSKKLQNGKATKQDERKKKDVLTKSGACSKRESDELKNSVAEENSSDISESLQRGPELRVTIEPLENPDIWNADFFRRRNLHPVFRVFAGVNNHGNVESVLRGVNDSIVIRNNVRTARRRKYEEESVRTSVRQSECAFRYKEIVVKKHSNYMQVVLVPNALKQNCLSIEAMKELKEAFVSAKKDSNCKAVLLNSSGSFFCSGVDLSQLLGPNKRQVAEEMAITVRDLIMTLGFFHKPVVAAVNGCAVGLGVTLLTFCDIVLASDKATFSIPAATLGYLPEGGVVLTLPQVVGATVAVEMLLQGRKLTAEQALKYGLVSEVLWPTQLMENVVPRMHMLVSQSLQVMTATKTMVRCYLWEKLPLQLEHEWHILSAQWQHTTCQQNIKKMLQTGWMNE